MSDDPTAAVVVVNYGSHELIDRPSFVALADHPRLRVVVVDSLHSAHERTQITRVCRDRGFALVPLDTNPGFGAGVNAGVAHALATGTPDALVLLNPDAEASPEALLTLAARVAADDALLLCPVIEHPGGGTWFGGGALDLRTGRTRTAGVSVDEVSDPWVSGACLAVHPRLWRRLGGMEERYFMYWEDVDLSHRARVAGATVRVDGDVRVVHLVGGTQGESVKSQLYRRYNCRNRLLFAAMRLDERSWRRWVRTSPGYAWLLAHRDGRRALARRPVSMLWAVTRGTLEGWWRGRRLVRRGR